MRAGLFGGTFNPIHDGHLMLARRAVQSLALERLYLIPCRKPPHKRPDCLAPGPDRLRMIELALPDDHRYRFSDIELQRTGPSYTIDTVVQFRTRILPAAELYLIMGLDAFLELHTWRSCQRLLRLIRPAVVFRPETEGEGAGAGAGQAAGRMDAYIKARLAGDYRIDDRQQVWRHPKQYSIHLLETAPMAVSSSQIRQRIRQGDPIDDLVPPAVNAYIEQKELYR